MTFVRDSALVLEEKGKGSSYSQNILACSRTILVEDSKELKEKKKEMRSIRTEIDTNREDL